MYSMSGELKLNLKKGFHLNIYPLTYRLRTNFILNGYFHGHGCAATTSVTAMIPKNSR